MLSPLPACRCTLRQPELLRQRASWRWRCCATACAWWRAWSRRSWGPPAPARCRCSAAASCLTSPLPGPRRAPPAVRSCAASGALACVHALCIALSCYSDFHVLHGHLGRSFRKVFSNPSSTYLARLLDSPSALQAIYNLARNVPQSSEEGHGAVLVCRTSSSNIRGQHFRNSRTLRLRWGLQLDRAPARRGRTRGDGGTHARQGRGGGARGRAGDCGGC